MVDAPSEQERVRRKSGGAGVQELENLELGEDFRREKLVLDFRIKTLLAYSATPDS